MAKSGRAGAALSTAAIGSFVAGTLSTLALSLAAPALVRIALVFGPAEYFALMVLAFVMVCSMLGPSLLRGLRKSVHWADAGRRRHRQFERRSRVSPLASRTCSTGSMSSSSPSAYSQWVKRSPCWVMAMPSGELLPVGRRISMTREEWSRSWKPWLRGTAIGFPLGALPAGGAELPTLLSYAVEKRLSSHPEEFGHGAIEGVAGPEAANNASAAGTLVPLLTLGLPTSATAAMLLAAFQQFGLQPGPLLFEREPELVWGVIASLYVGNVMLLVLNLPLVKLWVKLLEIPRPQLYAGILVVATLGAYSVHRSVGDLRPAHRDRRAGLRLAPGRDADCAGDDRLDPRTRGRSAVATGAGDQRRRLECAGDAADRGDAAHPGSRRGTLARPARTQEGVRSDLTPNANVRARATTCGRTPASSCPPAPSRTTRRRPLRGSPSRPAR